MKKYRVTMTISRLIKSSEEFVREEQTLLVDGENRLDAEQNAIHLLFNYNRKERTIRTAVPTETVLVRYAEIVEDLHELMTQFKDKAYELADKAGEAKMSKLQETLVDLARQIQTLYEAYRAIEDEEEQI